MTYFAILLGVALFIAAIVGAELADEPKPKERQRADR